MSATKEKMKRRKTSKGDRDKKYLYNFTIGELSSLSTDIRIGTYRFRSWYVPICQSVRTNFRTGYYQTHNIRR